MIETLSSTTLQLLIPIALALASSRLWRIYNTSSMDPSCSLPLPPGSMGIPFLGETLNLILWGAKFFEARRTSYGNIYMTHILGKPTIRVIGAKNVRKILMGENTLVSTQWPQSARIIMGTEALAHSVGPTHKRRRKLVQRAFSHESLKSYTPRVQKIVQGFITRWCEQGFMLGHSETKKLTFAAISKVLVGLRVPDSELPDMMETLKDLGNNIFSLPVCLPGTGLYKGIRARDRLVDKIKESINDVSDSDGLPSLISLLKQEVESEHLGDEEFQQLALEFLFAGFETTSSAACSLLMQLGQNPDVVRQITDELGEHGLLDDAVEVTFDDLKRLKYVTNVVKEVLRLLPPVGAGFRKAVKTFDLEGFQVPKGWTIAYSIRDTQQTTTMFENKDVFNPSRWDEIGQLHADDRFHYLPFGGGNRSCVGKDFAQMLLKVTTIELARSCSWTLINKAVRMRLFPTPHPVDGLPVEIKKSVLVPSYRNRVFTI